MKPTLGLFGVLAVFAISLPLSDNEVLGRAQVAFERGEFEAALKLYERLEERTADPGQVAYNKAAVLYRLTRHRDAELHYRRALEDATGRRRAAALYGLGNSLVQQGSSLGAQALGEAVRRYEECLALGEDEPLPEDVRHNLELARLLWLQAKADQKEPEKGSSEDEMKDDPPEGNGMDPKNSVGMGDPGASPRGVGDPMRVKPEPGKTPIKTDDVAPGKGTLPPVPDADELKHLSPEDAAAHLQRAMQKVLRERREYERSTAKPPAAGVKDW